jgi:MYXO-CTERM domain-containing protein
MPPDVADAGAPVDAAVSPVDAPAVDAHDTPGSGGRTATGGQTGTGGAVASGGVMGAGAGGSGAGGGPGTDGMSVTASGGGSSAGPGGAGGSPGTGGPPGNGAAQAGNGGCSCLLSPAPPRSSPALALLGLVVLALRVRKRR